MNKNKYFFLGFLLITALFSSQNVQAMRIDECTAVTGRTCETSCTAVGKTLNPGDSVCTRVLLSDQQCCVPVVTTPACTSVSGQSCGTDCAGGTEVSGFSGCSGLKCCAVASPKCDSAANQSCVSAGSCSGGTVRTGFSCPSSSVCCFTGGTGDTVPNISGLNYQLLEKIPGTSGLGSDLPGYISAIYKVALIIVTLSAVLMLSVGGFMYLTSAGNTSSISSAKTVITDALIGLVIALSAWLVLFIINPDLVKVSLSTLPPVAGSQTYVTTPPADGGTCSGCVPVDIPVKPVGQGCKAPGPCKLEAAYLSKLKTINSSQAWQVTEAHPPTVTHASTCHYNGRCSDINFTDKRIDVTSVKALYDAIKATGLSVVYETFADCAPYTTAGVSCKRFTNTTGSHFHVY